MTIHLICGKCGSDNVRADAYAAWDSEEGVWVLHTVYDERYCEVCDSSTNLLEIHEETGMEIGFYGMVNEGEGARLVQDDEAPDFYDVMARTTSLESGEILVLQEFENLNRKDANERMAFLTAIFPNAPIDWHHGKLPDSTF